MKIFAKYHGEIEVNVDEIIRFDRGIPGFLDEKEFVILPLNEEDTFYVLQSLNNQQLAFVIANPFHFFKAYDFKLEDTFVQELDLREKKEVLVFSILTVQDPFNNTTANLQAPIIINSTNKKAKQIILNDSNFRTKHPIFHGELSVPAKG